MAKCILKLLHRADDIKTLACAARAADHTDAAGAQAQGFQDFIANAHFFFGFSRQAHADRVADARPQQIAHADGGFYGSANKAACLGNSKMDGAVNSISKAHIGRNRQKDVRRLHRNLIFVEIMILKQLDMVQRAFNQRLGAWLAIFFEQIFFKTARVYADTDRATIGLGGVNDLFHTRGRSDIAWVDTQASGPRVRSLKRAFIMEVDVRDDGHIGRTDNLFQRRCALNIGARYADDINTSIFAAADLVDGCACVTGQRVGHRLHRNRGIAANGDFTDHDLAGLTARDIAPRAYRRHKPNIGGLAFSRNHHPELFSRSCTGPYWPDVYLSGAAYAQCIDSAYADIFPFKTRLRRCA